MNKNFRKLSILILSVLVSTTVLSACALGGTSDPSIDDDMSSEPMPFGLPQEEKIKAESERYGLESGNASPDSEHTNTTGSTSVDRLVIKNANLSIVVENPIDSLDNIGKMAESFGGFIVNANLYHTRIEDGTEVPRANITVRVPADKLRDALAIIEAESDREPLNKTVSSQDITGDYTDLESRLKNLERTEEQLQEILDKAYTTKDVLSVHERLVDIRRQIEEIKGRMKYYDESVSLSAISVEIIANVAIQPLKIGRWEPRGVAKSALVTLLNTLTSIVDGLIVIVILIIPTVLVIVLVVGLPIFFIAKAFKKRISKSSAPKEE